MAIEPRVVRMQLDRARIDFDGFAEPSEIGGPPAQPDRRIHVLRFLVVGLAGRCEVGFESLSTIRRDRRGHERLAEERQRLGQLSFDGAQDRPARSRPAKDRQSEARDRAGHDHRIRRMIRLELRPMIALAAPVVAAELGWIAMGLVDTLMVGRLGADAIGAVGLGSILFVAVAVFAMGMLLGLDPLVAQAYGAKDLRDCHRWLVDGVWLAALIALPLVALTLAIDAVLPFWGLPPSVLRLTQPYLGILAWSLPPLLLYVAFRRYLQALGIVTPVMVALILANVVNIVVNWILIFGRFGAPALGAAALLTRRFSRGSSWRCTSSWSSDVARLTPLRACRTRRSDSTVRG